MTPEEEREHGIITGKYMHVGPDDWYPPKTEDIRKSYANWENKTDESYLMGWYAEQGFDAWLKEELAKAWDAGHRKGRDNPKNPYREETE